MGTTARGLLGALILSLFCPQEADKMREFCQLEKFEARCPGYQVIVMEKALYGRMELGRCVKNAYGNLGCNGDVIMQMDRKCSGRNSCEFMVAELHGLQNCPEDLTPFLLASYTCQDVYTAADVASCTGGQPVPVTAQSGYLANVITEKSQLGSESCPWLLSVQPGQRFNLTVVNFARAPNVGAIATEDDTMNAGIPRICYQLATITENGVRRTLTECEGGSRVSRPFLSASHQLQVSMINRKSHDVYFLIKFEVIGCGTPRIPKGAILQRADKVAMIRCNFTEESWTVECDGNSWRGHIGNCSQDSPPGAGIFSAGSNFPYGILIVVAIGVALGVFFGGILLTLASFYMKRKRNDKEAYPTSEQMYAFHERKSMDTLSSYPYGRRQDLPSPRPELVDPRYNLKDCGAILEAPYNAYREAHSDVDFRPPHSPASHIYESPKFARKAT